MKEEDLKQLLFNDCVLSRNDKLENNWIDFDRMKKPVKS